MNYEHPGEWCDDENCEQYDENTVLGVAYYGQIQGGAYDGCRIESNTNLPDVLIYGATVYDGGRVLVLLKDDTYIPFDECVVDTDEDSPLQAIGRMVLDVVKKAARDPLGNLVAVRHYVLASPAYEPRVEKEEDTTDDPPSPEG